MGNTSTALDKVYRGPTRRLERATLLAKQPGLSQDVTKALLDSLGPFESMSVEKRNDFDPFEKEMINPKRKEFTPFYYDRGNEYGRNHNYWEALCHGQEKRDFIYTSSARYFKYTGDAITTNHTPVPLEIVAFINGIHALNQDFFLNLRAQLKKLGLSEKTVGQFVDGAFRNIAVQVHYGEKSHLLEDLQHTDHVFSALHLSITLNGSRTVGFTLKDGKQATIDINPGDVYCTTPSAIRHGIHVGKLSSDNRSIALQCRAMVSGACAKELHEKNTEVAQVVADLLDAHPLVLPSFTEWKEIHDKLQHLISQDCTKTVTMLSGRASALRMN